MSHSQRLASLALELPPVPTPVAHYVPARIHEGLVYSAGQLPFMNGDLLASGLVGESGSVTVEKAHECAKIAALNAIAAVSSEAGGIDYIEKIVRITGYVAAASDFQGHAEVLNGASAIVGDIFGDAGLHARTAVGVSSLPLGAPVEIEMIAAVREN